jgi:hypothetical protein
VKATTWLLGKSNLIAAVNNNTYMTNFRKTNFFYIDESGGILNDSPLFILGCIRTDTPQIISDKISKLLTDFENEIYYTSMLDQIREQGFHAVENHPDVRARLFAILPILNFRSFFCIINKSKYPYKELIENKEETRVYLLALDKLLKGRFNNRKDKNIFIFEELQFKDESQQKILENYFAPYKKGGHLEYKIVSKKEINLAIVDYMNYIFYTLLPAKDLKKLQRMVDNFELIKPKIAFINMLHSKIFFTRKKTFTIEQIVQTYSG